MADTKVKVEVETTADTKGIRDVRAELMALGQAGGVSVEKMKEMGVHVGTLGGKMAFLTAEGKKLAIETEKVAVATGAAAAEANALSGAFGKIQINKAVSEATVLARELATGSFQARTLGSLLGALGPTLTVGAIAGFALLSVIDSIGKAIIEAVKKAGDFEKEFAKGQQAILHMVETARDLTDAVKIGDRMDQQLEQARAFAATFRVQEMAAWKKWADEAFKFVRGIEAPGGSTTGPFETKRREEESKALEEVRQKAVSLNAEIDQTNANIIKWDELTQRVWAGDGVNALKEMQAEVDTLRQKVEQANAVRQADPGNVSLIEAYNRVNQRLEDANAKLKDLSKNQDQYTASVEASVKALDRMAEAINTSIAASAKALDKQTEAELDLFLRREQFTSQIEHQAAINNAAGNDELVIREKVNKTYDDTRNQALLLGNSEEEATRLAQVAASSAEHELEVKAGTGVEQSALNVQMKEYETILQDIRQQQTVVGEQAFIGVDQKNVQMLQLYREEIVKVINAMQQSSRQRGSLTDPTEIARANQEAQKLAATYQRLSSQIITMQHQFQSGLQGWANSFGSTGQQLANTLQQTVGAALQSFNQWIVTGKFNMQQLLQQIALLGLQLVEQLIIQRVVAMINARLAETQAVASSKVIAAAWASAATAVTIATEGQAAYTAPAAVAIGLAGVQAALGIGSLHEGGRVSDRRMHSGGLAADEVPIIAQEGEIMIRRDVAQAPGMADFLLGLNDGMFHQGGAIHRMHRGGDEFDPGRWADPNPGLGQPGGLQFRTSDIPGFWGDVYNPYKFGGYSNMMNRWLMGQGFAGPMGTPGWLQGPTMIPTTFNVQGYPRAVPVGPSSDINLARTGHFPRRLPKHEGGLISRMHSGGAVGGGGGGIHIYAFTDLKALTRHMGSREGQKIIFDTVQGRRIDLGLK